MLRRILRYCSDRFWYIIFQIFGSDQKLRKEYFRDLNECQSYYRNCALVLLSDGCDAKDVRECLLAGASKKLTKLGMDKDQEVRDALKDAIDTAVDAAALEMYSHHLADIYSRHLTRG